MAKVLCYTSPARGHLYPTVPVLLELRRRGHDVALLTLEQEVARMNAAGLRTRRVDAEIEAMPHDDWRARSPIGALDRAVRVFVSRAPHEVRDVRRAIETERPDLILVDFNSWGAAAEAERSGPPAADGSRARAPAFACSAVTTAWPMSSLNREDVGASRSCHSRAPARTPWGCRAARRRGGGAR